jgi:ssDNA-binding Zn-finger/Zn-ribbon topoisomerase 1
LTQTFTAKDLVDARFDVIIVDESSMAPLPHVYWAATKARLSATLVGDFAQLPPICVSDDEAAQAWLGRNIYALLGMDSLDLARADDRVCLLGTQYRMAPAIAELPNGLFYGGLLNHAPYTQSLVGGDPVLGPSSVTLVDIAGGRPWCSRILPRGRFNLYAAFVSACIARRIADATDWTVGVISPYKAQARLVDRIVKDWGLGDRIKASTVHTFQGGEEDAIILDCVESPGSGRWSMLDDGRNGASARQLLNVALTRARRKLVLVAHADYLERTFPQASALLAALRYCGEAGSVVRAEDLVSGYVAAGVDGLVEPAPALAGSPLVEGRLHTERDFWPAFVADLRGAERSVTIMSPFISLRRAGGLIEPLDQLRRKGVEVRCYTRPPSRQTGAMAEHAEEVIHQLEDLGVTVVQRTNMHQKVAVIDENVVWEGSLNILSHGHTEEQMRRLEGQNTAREVARNLRLSEEPSAGDVVQTPCPECGKPMVVRRGRFGEFLGCTGYPACQGKAPWRASRAKGTQAAPSPDAPRPDVAAEPSLGRPRQDKAPSPKRKAAAAKTSGSSGASTRCPKCGRRLVRRSGLHGPFLGCSGFPSCRYTRNARGHGRT